MPYSHLSNVTLSSEEHDAEMMAKPVSVRDGDDLIEVSLGEDELDTNSESIQITLGDESDEDEDETSVEEDEGTESENEDGEEGEIPEYHKVDPKDMNEAADLMREAEVGQAELTAKAVEAGLPEAAMETMKAEYEKNGKFSEASYAELAKVGYTKAFIDSYMAGQEAVATRYVESIMKHVGGVENYNKISKFIAEKQPDVAIAFDAAVERNDVATIRALLDSAVGQIRQSPASKAPKRNIANAAKPAAPAKSSRTDNVEGFKNRAEMTKAMRDVRYGRDAEYRREVELKVLHSTF